MTMTSSNYGLDKFGSNKQMQFNLRIIKQVTTK